VTRFAHQYADARLSQELARTVGLDLERLHPGDAFFASRAVQGALRGVLMVWALRHPAVSYRQGMHEVAAVLFAVLHADACGSRDAADTARAPSHSQPQCKPSSHTLALCSQPESVSGDDVDAGAGACDARYLEHDAAALFAAVMAGADADLEAPGLGLSLYYEDAPLADAGGVQRQAPVHASLARIWASLAAVDAQLHGHLSSLGVEPQLFLLKWLRLLFGREFHFDDVIVVWDALIAATADGFDAGRRPGECIEAMACAMILYLRENLLAAREFGACLRRLQKFPPVEHVEALVERATAIVPAVQAVGRRPLPAAQREPASPAGLGFAVPARRAPHAPPPAPQLVHIVTSPTPAARFSAARLALGEDAANLAGALGQLNSAEINSALDDISTDLNAAVASIKDSTRSALGGLPASPAASLRGAFDSSVGGLLRSVPPSPLALAQALSPSAAAEASPAARVFAPGAPEMRWSRSMNDLVHGDELRGVGADASEAPAASDVEANAPPAARMANAAAALAPQIDALDGLLRRMRSRWSAADGAAAAGAEAEGAAAQDAAALAEALKQLRSVHARLAA